MPTTRPLTIKIAGTDRTTSIPNDSITLDQSVSGPDQDLISSCRFTVLDGAGMSLDTNQVVQLLNENDNNEKYFEGTIRSIADHSRGIYVDYDIEVVGYEWNTGHGSALISSSHSSEADTSIISTIVAASNSDIDATTHVEAVGTPENISFDTISLREALGQLSRRVGAYWYIDPDKNLHWMGTQSTSPFILTDDPAAGEAAVKPNADGTWGVPIFGEVPGGGLSTTLVGYEDFERQWSQPEATQVTAVGAGTVSATASDSGWGGTHIAATVYDKDLASNAAATTMAEQVLQRSSINNITYTMTIREPGLQPGERVRLINAARNIDDYFTVNKCTTTWFSSSHVECTIELGKHQQTLAEMIADVAKNTGSTAGGGGAGGGGGGGAGKGRTAGAAPREHSHGGGADGVKIGTDALDGVNYWSTVAGDTGSETADISGDTLTVTGGTAIDTAVTSDDTVTINMDGVIRAQGGAASGAPSAPTNVGWGSGAAPQITFVSDDSSVTIQGDAGNNEINFEVSSSVGNAFGIVKLDSDSSTLAEANTTHDTLRLAEGNNITITGDGDETVTITAASFTGAATAYTTINGDSGSTTAGDASDTLALVGGTGITTTASEPGTDQVSIAIDSTVAQAAFTTVAAPNADNPIATAPGETLTFAEGTAIDIAGDQATDTVTFVMDGTIEGVGWPAGDAPNINLDSPNSTIDITTATSEIRFDVNTTNVSTLAYKGVNTDSGNVVSVTPRSTLEITGGTAIATAGTNRADTADGVTVDTVTVNFDGKLNDLSWPSGPTPNIDLKSDDSSITISNDGNDINFELNTAVAGGNKWNTIYGNNGTTTADELNDSLGIVGDTGITVVAVEGPADADVEVETLFGSHEFGTYRFGGATAGDFLKLKIEWASTSEDVSANASAAGTGESVARHDHTHRGVSSFAESGGSAVYGDVTISEGNAITITPSGQDFAIAVSGLDTSDLSDLAYAAPALTYGTSNSAGVANTVMRTDATIDIFNDLTADPEDVKAAAADGTDAYAARRDHEHRGVASIQGPDTTDNYGTITLSQGNAIAITENVNDFEIAVSGLDVNDITDLAYAAPTITLGAAAAEGVADTVIRSDATIQGVRSLTGNDGGGAKYGDITLVGNANLNISGDLSNNMNFALSGIALSAFKTIQAGNFTTGSDVEADQPEDVLVLNGSNEIDISFDAGADNVSWNFAEGTTDTDQLWFWTSNTWTITNLETVISAASNTDIYGTITTPTESMSASGVNDTLDFQSGDNTISIDLTTRLGNDSINLTVGSGAYAYGQVTGGKAP